MGNSKIIGRQREMAELKRCLDSNRSELVIVYGRRRVGKTFLVDQFFYGSFDFTYVGGHNLPQRVQLRNFAKALKQAAGQRKASVFVDWFYLRNKMSQKRISSNYITQLAPNEVFVFGSNLHGMHGGGAARLEGRELDG